MVEPTGSLTFAVVAACALAGMISMAAAVALFVAAVEKQVVTNILLFGLCSLGLGGLLLLHDVVRLLLAIAQA